ncbi:MAG TPA: hypothetical protein VK100_05175 [Pseudogracilibacillus sp.]|nr:hypothetical protein [Pseudogracilibacillus sp.]
MKQAVYGSILLIFLMLPPVTHLAESIMSIHMHMQMPLIAIGGMLLTPFLQKKFPSFFEKYNENGIPGIILFFIIMLYWIIPKAMDDVLSSGYAEAFKFISWALLGIALRDSWSKISRGWEYIVFIGVAIMYMTMAGLYIFSPDQLCNNYLIVEQRTLGWSYFFIALCLLLYFIQDLFADKDAYQES